MKRILYKQLFGIIVLASLNIGFGIWFHLYFPRLHEFPPNVTEFVKTTADIEKLRLLTQQLAQAYQDQRMAYSELVEEAVETILICGFGCVILLASNMLTMFKVRDMTLRKSPKWWWRWC